jgi:C-terminal processing protease CtpA/Prc
MTRQLAEYFQVPDGRGVLIEEVEKESPAARAGFAAGDVIINVGSDRVYDTDDIGWALDDRKAGETVEVTVIRKGARKTLNVQVADRQGRLKFRSEREIYIPEPPDIDIDIDIPEEQEEARLQKEGFRRSLEQFRIQMHGLKDEIRGWAHELQTRLRGGIRVRYTI